MIPAIKCKPVKPHEFINYQLHLAGVIIAASSLIFYSISLEVLKCYTVTDLKLVHLKWLIKPDVHQFLFTHMVVFCLSHL